MLRHIDKQYLMDFGFKPFNCGSFEKLKGVYPFVKMYNERNEIDDVLSVEIVLVQENGNWLIEKCYTDGEEKDVFHLFFKNNRIKGLIDFHRLNHIDF